MRVTELAKKYGLEVKELKAHLEELGVPPEGRSNLSTVSDEVAIELRSKLGEKNAEKIKESGEHVTTLPSGDKVIILFSEKKSLKIALPNGINAAFDHCQMILDTEDEADMALYDMIMKIGPADAFVVSPNPYPEMSGEREAFDAKLTKWLRDSDYGASGQPSVRGSMRVQALFHREEQEQVMKKRGKITAGTLKMSAVNSKSLLPAKAVN